MHIVQRLVVPTSLALAMLLTACAPTPPAKPTLYQRLGGMEAIKAVVEDFVGNVAADERINKFFVHADPVRLKRLLVEQICAGTGGGCTYTGRDMVSTHQGMNIRDADFNALVEDLVKTLNKFKVPQQEQSELLGILGPMKPAIVTAK